jgi:replicative DNA helicase
MSTNIAGFSIDQIEQAALASAMKSEQAMAEAAANLTPEHFTVFANRALFAELRSCFEQRLPTDLLLFTAHLSKVGLLNKVGGVDYVTHVSGVVPSAANLKYYIGILDDEHDKRRAQEICEHTIAALKAGDGTAVSRAISDLTTIPVRQNSERTLRSSVLEKVQRMEEGEGDADVIRTGLTYLDQHSPLRKGDMPLISGERKAGKSILALSIATNVARSGIPVLYFSLEDRLPKLVDRLFAGVSRIPMHDHCVSRMSLNEQAIAIETGAKIAELPFVVRDDVYDLHIITAVARQEKMRHETGLIVVDYAQLVRAVGTDTRREEVERVSRELRLLAMELDTPILLLCQLNKDGETRESKALEMDATAMWRIDRTDVDENGRRLIAIPWQRNGESGIGAEVVFLGSIARVENKAGSEVARSEPQKKPSVADNCG